MQHSSLWILTILVVFSVNADSWKFNEKLQSRIKVCPRHTLFNTNGTQFEWRYDPTSATTYFASQSPLCWDAERKEIVIRKCQLESGLWTDPGVSCTSRHEQQSNRFCPEDLLELSINKKYICLKLSQQTHAWNESICYGSDTLLHAGMREQAVWRAVLAYVQTKNIKEFWIPATRPTDNVYNPLVWRLPGEHWGEEYDMDNVADTDIIGSANISKQTINASTNCLIAHRDAAVVWKMRMTQCEHKYHSLCVFRKQFVAATGCPQNFKALSYRPNECYGIQWEDAPASTDMQLLTMADYYERYNSLKLIFKAIEMKSHMYFLLDAIIDDDGKQYNVKINSAEQVQIRPWDTNKSALSKEVVQSKQKVQMTLKLDPEIEGLVLTVYNRYYIWRLDDGDDNDDDGGYGIKCFTNADYEMWKQVKIKLIWENDRQTKTMFELRMEGDGPGYYWCEAHTIFNFALVRTPKVVAANKQKGHAFAMFYEVPRTLKNCRSAYKNLKKIAKEIRTTLRRAPNAIFEDLKIYNVRIMEITWIAEDCTRMRVLCHITAALKSSTVDSSDEWSNELADSEEIEYGIRHDTTVRRHLRDLLRQLIGHEQPQLAMYVNSTEYCFPEAVGVGKNQWMQARHGQTGTTQQLCLQRNGLPLTRACLGDFLYGAYWAPVPANAPTCISNTEQRIITQQLYELDTSNKPPKQLVHDLKELLEENLNHLIPADFYYMSRIIHSIAQSVIMQANATNKLDNSNKDDSDNSTIALTLEIVRIFNYLMKVNGDIIHPSIKLNSTNVLLDAFENFIDKIARQLHLEDVMLNSTMRTAAITATTSSKKSKSEVTIEDSDRLVDTIDYQDVGVVVKITTKFVIFVIDPRVANITGVALFNADEYSDEDVIEEGLLRGAFKEEFYRFILSNQTLDELLYEPGIEVATYVPQTLWYRLDEIAIFSNSTATPVNEETTRIVIKIYSNDVLFQEDRTETNKKVLGKIISVSIPGRDKDLPEMLPLVLRMPTSNSNDDYDDDDYAAAEDTAHGCGYWNYETWVSDGLVYMGRSEIDRQLIVCGCTHLTPFAYLIGGSFNFSVDADVVVITKMHAKALDIITLLGCSLSLFGIVGIVITALVFQTWRQKASSKVLLQLSAAIALQMVLFLFVNTESLSQHLIEQNIFSSCIALGASLHYSVLVQFCWMAVIAYLQFKRYVQVFGNTRPKRFFFKSTLIGWGLPLLPVSLVLLLDRESYIPSNNAENTASICYPTGYSLLFGIVVPIILVIVANLGIFCVIIYNVLRGPDGGIRHTDKRLALSQIRLSVLLFFLLGFTWIFGLLIIMNAGILFSYLFSLTATLQGFVLFIYFIVLDPVTRRMWSGCLRHACNLKRKDFESSTSMKETTQTQ